MSEEGAGEVLSESGEVLLRQIHPTWIHPEHGVMRVAFTPTKKDAGRLSTLHGRVGAEEAYKRSTRVLTSAGTWGVSVGEASAEQLPCREDGGIDGLPPDHVSIDFGELSGGPLRQAGRKLKDAAASRGCMYAPQD